MEMKCNKRERCLCDNHDLVKVYTFTSCLVAKISWHADSKAGKTAFSPTMYYDKRQPSNTIMANDFKI
jgi:hypothetical protein